MDNIPVEGVTDDTLEHLEALFLEGPPSPVKASVKLFVMITGPADLLVLLLLLTHSCGTLLPCTTSRLYLSASR